MVTWQCARSRQRSLQRSKVLVASFAMLDVWLDGSIFVRSVLQFFAVAENHKGRRGEGGRQERLSHPHFLSAVPC